ncbi:MAG: ROK family transcriptional regulator [Clostridia bacterium]|nr:ROK family transcriptional regulator [Clostridia bacterium]
MKPIALSDIRQQNLRKMLGLLTLAPAMTRQELARATGLSLMTVTNLVDALKQQEVLRLVPIDRPMGTGRKAEAISLRGDSKAWLAVNISGRQLQLMLMGFDMKPLYELESGGEGDHVENIRAFLAQAKEEMPAVLGERELLGVAVVTPGPYEIDSDTVSNQRIPELNGVKIKQLFTECLGAYEYYVDEDVKFAVRAFFGAIEQHHYEMLYYLFIGEGVGGAVVHNGDMLRGRNATAGDAGQLADRDGKPYERRLSLAAFVRLAGLDAGGTPEQLQQRIDELIRSAPDRYAAALTQAADVTAEMLHDVVWLLDPACIIIDCRYDRDGAFIRQVKQALQDRFAGTGRILPEIVAPRRQISSTLRGAVQVLQRAWIERKLG